MAKQTKKAKRIAPRARARPSGVVLDPAPSLPPPQAEFKRAGEFLRNRAGVLILDLAKRYVASKAAELTTVLDAMDSLAEFERMHRPPVCGTGGPFAGPEDPVTPRAEGGAGPPATSGIAIPDRSGAEAVMTTGTVKWFNSQKGFGFIVHTGTGKDVFVHISALEKAGLSTLNEGQLIEFELEESRGKASAVNLKLK